MKKEIEALQANDTWVLTYLPIGKKVISSKWAYKVKLNADGSLKRHKARLVIEVVGQKAGIDYQETFSPVVKMTTIRAMICVAVHRHWDIFQMDVNNVFLHGDIEE
ncbi:putative mitochondrial protein AtMg00820 [Silene latifolia]|uniref:putative mitochondrial protein AtMg00820 n=1 Tax=Silene latifolia TaxID=37657 RepID=UPI003D784F22